MKLVKTNRDYSYDCDDRLSHVSQPSTVEGPQRLRKWPQQKGKNFNYWSTSLKNWMERNSCRSAFGKTFQLQKNAAVNGRKEITGQIHFRDITGWKIGGNMQETMKIRLNFGVICNLADFFFMQLTHTPTATSKITEVKSFSFLRMPITVRKQFLTDNTPKVWISLSPANPTHWISVYLITHERFIQLKTSNFQLLCKNENGVVMAKGRFNIDRKLHWDFA